MCCKLQNEYFLFYSEGPIDRGFRAADKTPKSGNAICNTSFWRSTMELQGIAASVAVSLVLASQLWSVSPRDPITLGTAC